MPGILEKNSVDACRVCRGRRVVPKNIDGAIYLEDCVCVKKYDEEYKYEKAGIPRRYWDFGLRDLDNAFRKKNADQLKRVDDYIQNLDANIDQGEGLWFCSAPGLGKSTAIVSILKAAFDKEYHPYFIRASRIIRYKFDALRDTQAADLLDYIVETVNILAIEEFEKLYLAGDDAMNNQLFYEFLEDIYDQQKAILISSNKLPKEVLKRFPTFIQDRLRLLKPIIFTGLSERRAKSKL